LLLREVPEWPHVLTQRVGLAAIAACERVAGVRPVLKWPNDLLLGDVKLAGILAQADLAATPPAVVVGIGLNVGWAPDGSARLGDGIDPLAVLAAMLQAYDELPTDVLPLYREHLSTLGRRVRIELPDGVVEGRALDIEPDGRLVVVDDCAATHRFAVGDVVHLR
jgi:BirA family biotin operon repressor/biotin-[acetyl-CoA-carboxylase] ligase